MEDIYSEEISKKDINYDDISLDTNDELALEAANNRKALEESAMNMWGYSAVGVEAKKAAMTMLSTKTGMYARIPILCKADDCPYAESCQLLPYNLAPRGEYCPIETTQIEYRFQGYAQDFGIDDASFTDKCLINEIINCDIMMERCTALMAKEGSPVVDMVIGISERGEEIVQPEVSKFWEAYERTVKKRNEAYGLMMATRKDRKNEERGEKSISQILSEAIDGNDFIVESKPKGMVYLDTDKEAD